MKIFLNCFLMDWLRWKITKGGRNMLFDEMFFFGNGHWNDEDDDDW